MPNAYFPDLGSAGRALAPLLQPFASPDVIVLGLVRGGVPVAVEVARALSLPLDIILQRRLMAPYGPADVLMAAWVAGNFVIDERLPAAANAVHGGAAFLSDALDAFADAKGNVNKELPQSKWEANFKSQESNTLVEFRITYPDLAQLETTIKMGFKEGLSMAMEGLDELLPKLKKHTA